MNYPLLSEYIEAIRLAEDNFDQLSSLRPVLDARGNPIMSSGNFAVVFKMRDEKTGKLHAVKCFLKEQEGRADAYRMIAEELEYVDSSYLTPIKYIDKELYVDTNSSDETEFPILLMDWVDGVTLDRYVRENINYQYNLSTLAYRFSRMAMWLMPQPFAHGDLKPDNILVKADGTLVLVDYDGMYVPAMKGLQSRELGSPDFRHPNRTAADFDEHIDDFSLASILLSLKAISLQPGLLEKYGAKDRLLFSEKDYGNIADSKVLEGLRPLMGDVDLVNIYSLFLLSVVRGNLLSIPINILGISKAKMLSGNKPQSKKVNNSSLLVNKDNITFNVAGVSFKMIHVDGGTFQMGATSEQESDAYSDEYPVHSVTLSDYWIGETEVTQALWQAVMGSNFSIFKGAQRPVECVSWNDCQEFVNKLNSMLSGQLPSGRKFRLPTEAEWEYAARGGNKAVRQTKYSGSDDVDEVAWHEDNSDDETHDVKTKKCNALGLYDMSGNVWEWCQDWYDEDYYQRSPQTNPTGPSSGSYRVYRGGCWRYDAGGCHVSIRLYDSDPLCYYSYLGLRVAL